MATVSPIFHIPAPQLTDGANIETAITPMRDRIEVVLNALIPVGFIVWDAGSAIPTLEGWVWDYADGGLIDRTTYLAFFNRVGHAHNGSIDPGANKVRKPDKRGRGIIGADAFPASPISGAAGAAGRLTTAAGHSNARGQAGGEERHTQTLAELVAHVHDQAPMGVGGNVGVLGDDTDRPAVVQGNSISATRQTSANRTVSAGSGLPFNVLGPYQAEYALVRVA